MFRTSSSSSIIDKYQRFITNNNNNTSSNFGSDHYKGESLPLLQLLLVGRCDPVSVFHTVRDSMIISFLRRQHRFASTTLLLLSSPSCRGGGLAAALSTTSRDTNNPSRNNDNDKNMAEMNNNNALLQNAFINGTNLSPYVDLLHIQDRPIASTQDEARQLLREKYSSSSKNNHPLQYLAVIADHQTKGRGTQGRQWEGSSSSTNGGTENNNNNNTTTTGTNLFLTVCVPMDRIPVLLTLLPLQIGVLVAERVEKLVQACHHQSQQQQQVGQESSLPQVTVKWPNDVLVNDQKISGTLMENELVDDTVWLVIGIGINVAYSPNLSKSPGKQVRKACCVQDFCNNNNNDTSFQLPSQTAAVLGMDLASGIIDWVVQNQNAKTDPIWKQQLEHQVVESWRSYAAFGKPYELRGQHVDSEHGGYQGEQVVTLGIQPDGQLLVRGENGETRLLVADYLF